MTIKYVGQGSHIPGVPARDLTEAEYALYKKTIKAQEKLTGVTMYEVGAEVVEGEDK
jgi:hypothetical protein